MDKDKKSELRTASFCLSLCIIVFSLVYFIYTDQIFERFPTERFVIIIIVSIIFGLIISRIKNEKIADIIIQSIFLFARINKQTILEKQAEVPPEERDFSLLKFRAPKIYYFMYFFVSIIIIFSIIFISIDLSIYFK